MNNNSKSYIKFIYKYEDTSNSTSTCPPTKIKYIIDNESSITECVKAFENFLLSCGYRLPNNCSIDIVEH